MLKHNKKKNSGIVYEQLMTLATRLAMTRHVNEAKLILRIVKEHFHPQTELGKEKKLFDSVIETKNLSKEQAEAILSEALIETKLIKEQALNREKTLLINRILNEIGKDLFSIPLKEYKLLASIQILFNETRNNFKHSKPHERVKIKNTLVENMSRVIAEEDDNFDDLDNFTYNLLVTRFNEKYSPLMNEDQRAIVSGWIDFLVDNNKNKFISLLEEKRLKAKGMINSALVKQEHQNSSYKELLEEAGSSIRKNIKSVDEEVVYETMRYFDLIEDLEEVSKNDQQIPMG